MADLIINFFFFFLSVAVHLIICQRHKKSELLITIFFFISGVGLLFYFLVVAFFHHLFSSSAESLWTVPLPMTSTLLYILLVFLYLSLYVNVQLVSPSKKIMLLIRDNGVMSEEQLLKHFTDDGFIQPRLDDLVVSRCCRIEKGRYCLSHHGKRIAHILEIYQKILGRPMGG